MLTATPEPACELALKNLEFKGVRIAWIKEETSNYHLLPSQTAVNLELRSQPERDQWLLELAEEVVNRFREKPDRHGAVILDSKDHINRLADLLYARGLGGKCGRITGSTPKGDRKLATQRPIILATSTEENWRHSLRICVTRQSLGTRKPKEDSILFFPLCACCQGKIERIGGVEPVDRTIFFA